MKKILIVTACLITLVSFRLDAQPNFDWKQKMMSEKIAFLTTEIGITPQEAQKFWPVYNELNTERDQIMGEIFICYKELEDAVTAKKPAKEIEKLLKKYLDAQARLRKTDEKTEESYKKVLSIDKVARLYVAEEKFRRMQIHRLHRGRP